jgi:hypothetical protein
MDSVLLDRSKLKRVSHESKPSGLWCGYPAETTNAGQKPMFNARVASHAETMIRLELMSGHRKLPRGGQPIRSGGQGGEWRPASGRAGCRRPPAGVLGTFSGARFVRG